MNGKFPQHLAPNERAWRAKKRTEWKAVMNALERFTYGAAYVPDGTTFYEITRLAKMYERSLKGGWIAW